MLYATIIYHRSRGSCDGGEFFTLVGVSGYSLRLESIDVAPRSIVFDRHSRGGATQRRAVSTINCASNRIILGQMFAIRIDLASVIQTRSQRKLVRYDRSRDGTVTYRMMVMTNNKVNTRRPLSFITPMKQRHTNHTMQIRQHKILIAMY